MFRVHRWSDHRARARSPPCAPAHYPFQLVSQLRWHLINHVPIHPWVPTGHGKQSQGGSRLSLPDHGKRPLIRYCFLSVHLTDVGPYHILLHHVSSLSYHPSWLPSLRFPTSGVVIIAMLCETTPYLPLRTCPRYHAITLGFPQTSSVTLPAVCRLYSPYRRYFNATAQRVDPP